MITSISPLRHLTPHQILFLEMLVEGPIQCSHIDDSIGEELMEMGLVKFYQTKCFTMWKLTIIGRLSLYLHDKGVHPYLGPGGPVSERTGEAYCASCDNRCTRGLNITPEGPWH